MAIEFVFYTPEWEPAVARFNRRMREGNAPADFTIPERSAPLRTGSVCANQFLAVEMTGTGADEVRGGVILLEHPAYVGGESPGVRTVLNLQSPLSEAIIDAKFAMISIQLIRAALKRCPYAYVVGMGNLENPLPRLLKASGWNVRPVPFFFRLLRPARCLTQLRPLQRSAPLRLAAQLAAYSGAGALALKVAQRRKISLSGLTWQQVHEPDELDNQTWQEVEKSLSFGVVRDRSTMPGYLSAQIKRYRVMRPQGPPAWFSLLLSQMNGHSYFGNMKVATLVDLIAPNPGDLPLLAAAATAEAVKSGCDILVSNHLGSAPQQALGQAGFLRYNSNYLIASSKALSAAMIDATSLVSRQDGDGLVNLYAAPA